MIGFIISFATASLCAAVLSLVCELCKTPDEISPGIRQIPVVKPESSKAKLITRSPGIVVFPLPYNLSGRMLYLIFHNFFWKTANTAFDFISRIAKAARLTQIGIKQCQVV